MRIKGKKEKKDKEKQESLEFSLKWFAKLLNSSYTDKKLQSPGTIVAPCSCGSCCKLTFGRGTKRENLPWQ